MNAKIAHAVVNGALDNEGFMQGLLLQLLQRIEKKSRGIFTLRGPRARNETATERNLIEESALTLAILGGNRAVCKELGQRVKPFKCRMADLPSHSLPNAMLALLSSNHEQLQENIQLIDQLFHRTSACKKRRLLMAVDATYLEKAMLQMSMGQTVGLVGGGWSIDNEEECFWPLAKAHEKKMKAPQMMEFLITDPSSPCDRRSYSLCSMPMFLKAMRRDEGVTKTHAGNWEPGTNVDRVSF